MEESMEMDRGLIGLILGQFKSQRIFAERIGWSPQKLNRILNRSQEPTIPEVQEIAEGLGVPFVMVAKFFLTEKSQNG